MATNTPANDNAASSCETNPDSHKSLIVLPPSRTATSPTPTAPRAEPRVTCGELRRAHVVENGATPEVREMFPVMHHLNSANLQVLHPADLVEDLKEHRYHHDAL